MTKKGEKKTQRGTRKARTGTSSEKNRYFSVVMDRQYLTLKNVARWPTTTSFSV